MFCESHIPIHESNGKLALGRSNIGIKLINYVDMYYLNISHLERDGIIENDAISIDDPIKYLGIYEKNDFEVANEKSIYQSFSKHGNNFPVFFPLLLESNVAFNVAYF